MFAYSALNRALTVRADFHIGARVNALTHLRTREAPRHPGEIQSGGVGGGGGSNGMGGDDADGSGGYHDEDAMSAAVSGSGNGSSSSSSSGRAQSRKARALQSRLAAAAVSRHMQLCADLDGGMHRLVPLDDAVFHRLMSLQTKVRAVVWMQPME